MATLDADKYMTLIDVANMTLGKDVLPVAQTMSEVNSLIETGLWIPSNLPTSHRYVQQMALPTGTFRKVSGAVIPEKVQTKPMVEGMAMLEAYSVVDARLFKGVSNPQMLRKAQDDGFIEGLTQNFALTSIEGDISSDPEQIDGLETRYNKLGANCQGGGGDGSDTYSILVVQWGPKAAHFIYPSGGNAVIQREDKGKMTLGNNTDGYREAWVTYFAIEWGWVINDARCVQRIANLESTGATNIFDSDLLLQALNNLPDRGQGGYGKPVIYMNRTGMDQLEADAIERANVLYSVDAPYGKPQTNFRGVPVKLLDQLTIEETVITA